MKNIREVRVIDLITYLLFPIIALPAVIVLVSFISSLDIHNAIRIMSIISIIYPVYWLLKRMAIGAVLAYKAFAPMSIRKECRFEPTCSTYMVMAINKYGLFIGIYKGIRRIMRCHPPNGGIDYP
jgi:putative membrane protein insertion efficiency factor